MSQQLTLVDSASLGDLATYLGRAARIEDGSTRLIAGSGVLAAYTAAFYPAGLHDDTPTVLGLRTFALTDRAALDVVVPLRSMLDRLARLTASTGESSAPVTVSLPLEVNTVVWAAISPPRGGWLSLPDLPGSLLNSVAEAGIREVKEAVGTESGQAIVERVRREVWNRPIDGFEHVPAGAAFTAHALGFLAEGEDARVLETGPWTRLTTQRGHVLVRRKPWTLQR